MRNTITITSKGQTTLPAEVRRKLGLGAAGGVLQIDFNEHEGKLVITKPLSVRELSQLASSYIQPGSVPLTNVDEFYQANRQART